MEFELERLELELGLVGRKRELGKSWRWNEIFYL